MLILLGLILTLVARSTLGQSCDAERPCPPGSDCHPTEGQCYQDPPATNRPYVWLGTAPDNCTRTSVDCALFGFEYNMSHPRGDSAWCTTGNKIRCFAPLAPPVAEPTPVNELRVISYNVFERDFSVTYDGQRERTCRIPYLLLQGWPTLDAVGIQEGFMGGCFDEDLNIRDLFKYLGFPHATPTIRHDDVPENGGIFIVSRWPILEHDQLVFQSFDDISADSLAAKGVSYAKIRKTSSGQSQDYHFMTTHYQAGRINQDIRENQTHEWANFVRSKNISSGERVIYSGDINADYYEYPEHLNEILNILQANLPNFTGNLSATTTPENDVRNSTSGPFHVPKWIDYALHSRVHQQPQTATLESLFPHAEQPFPVCWCPVCIPLDGYAYHDNPNCEWVNRIRHPSDHQPVLGTFIF